MDIYELSSFMRVIDPRKENLIKKTALNFQPILPLGQLASIKLVTWLWSRKCIQDELLPGANEFKVASLQILVPRTWNDVIKTISVSPTWKKVVKKVKTDISEINIPASFYSNLYNINSEVNKYLLKWIVNANSILCRTPESRTNSIHYLNHIAWTQFGKIAEEATARSLLTAGDLSNEDKLLIACNYCLEEDVYKYAPANEIPSHLLGDGWNVANWNAIELAPGRLFPNYSLPESLAVEDWPTVHYWNAVLNKNADLWNQLRRYNHMRNVKFSMEKFMLIGCSTKHYTRETAVKYLWNKLSLNDKIELTAHLITLTCDVELGTYFLYKLELEENRLMVLGRCYLSWLRSWMNHFLWQDYFFTLIAFYWDAMTCRDCYLLCDNTLVEMKTYADPIKSRNYFKVFLNMWYRIPEHIKNEMFDNGGTLVAKMLRQLPWERDLTIVGKVISTIDKSKRKNVIYSDVGRESCVNFIKLRQWECYDLFTTSMLPEGKEELFQFKRLLIIRKDMNLMTDFIRGRGWDREKEFFEWFFRTESARVNQTGRYMIEYLLQHEHWHLLNFYLNVAYPEKHDLYEMKKTLIKSHGIRFAESFLATGSDPINSKDFLRWFFQVERKHDPANRKLLSDYLKKTIQMYPLPIDVPLMTYFFNWTVEPSRNLHAVLKDDKYLAVLRNSMKYFVKKSQFALADDVLDWYFNDDTATIINFKKNLMMNRRYKWDILTISLLKIKNYDRMASLRNFVRWGFPNGDEHQFKAYLLGSNAVWKLLRNTTFLLAHNFVSWCVDACPEKIVKFKNDAFLSRKFETIVKIYDHPKNKCMRIMLPNYNPLKNLLLWFNPSPEVIKIFKSRHSQKRYKIVRKLLNKLFNRV